MEDVNVHSIGMTELYTEIRSLGDKFSDYTNRHDVEASTRTYMIADVRADLTALEIKFETERVNRAAASKQAFWAILTSLLFPIIVGIVLYVTNK